MAANGIGAANTLAGYRDLRYGMCLFYVWQAYKANGAEGGIGSGTALEGWYNSADKHEGDRNPPAGVPVWFGAKPSSSAGDVVISLGGGRVVCTDYPRYGVVGICTIQERQDQIGRPYLGWTETILSAAIDFPRGGSTTPNPGGSSAPNLSEEDEMRIIYSQHLEALFLIGDGGVTRLYNNDVALAYNAIGVSGNRNINQLGKEDFRMVIEALGISYERTRLLKPGERLQKFPSQNPIENGLAVLDAGNVSWGPTWA